LKSKKEKQQLDIFRVYGAYMSTRIALGEQSFYVIRDKKCFYIDKTYFIKDWWNSNEKVTLIARPRRFGKTLTLDTVKTFFLLNSRIVQISLEGSVSGGAKNLERYKGQYQQSLFLLVL